MTLTLKIYALVGLGGGLALVDLEQIIFPHYVSPVFLILFPQSVCVTLTLKIPPMH